MAILACRKCGGRIIIRKRCRFKDGRVLFNPKGIPIHLDGACGQMLLPFAKRAAA